VRGEAAAAGRDPDDEGGWAASAPGRPRGLLHPARWPGVHPFGVHGGRRPVGVPALPAGPRNGVREHRRRDREAAVRAVRPRHRPGDAAPGGKWDRPPGLGGEERPPRRGPDAEGNVTVYIVAQLSVGTFEAKNRIRIRGIREYIQYRHLHLFLTLFYFLSFFN